LYPPPLKNCLVCLIGLLAAVFLLTFLGVKETYANMRTASLTASVTVLPYFQFNLLSQVSEITITEEDIQRGYLDVRSASLLELKTNSHQGYLLSFEGSLWPFKEVQIQGLANHPVRLDSGHSLVHQPSARGKVTMNLDYRFILSGEAKPGSYSWPLLISVHPI
jgi:hypothetical protein